MRNFPPNETAGLGRDAVRGYKRSPCPPANINADVRTRWGAVVSVIGFICEDLSKFLEIPSGINSRDWWSCAFMQKRNSAGRRLFLQQAGAVTQFHEVQVGDEPIGHAGLGPVDQVVSLTRQLLLSYPKCAGKSDKTRLDQVMAAQRGKRSAVQTAFLQSIMKQRRTIAKQVTAF
jgi:hypothetical protein